jgi:TRAP-type mannitol/chloroaromatic compound transport system substrate-binding protein
LNAFDRKYGPSMRAFGFLLTLAVSVIGLAPSALAQQPGLRLTFASTFPSSMALIGEGATRLPRKIARVSGGDIELQFHEPGVLVPAAQTLHAVSLGAVDAGWGGAGWFTAVDTAFNMFSSVPFGPGIGEYMAWMYHGGGLELARELFAGHNLHNIPCAVIPPEASGWFRKEIRTVADLRGLRMRFFGLGAKVMEKLGVTTHLIAPGEILQAMQADRIDATEFSLPAMDQKLGFHRAAKYYYFPGWHQQATFFDLYVNRGRWKAMTDRQRAVLELACGDMIRESIAEGEAMQWKAMAEMQAEGVQIRRWAPEIIAAMESAWNEVVAEESARNANFRRIYASYDAFRRDYSIWRDHAYLK